MLSEGWDAKNVTHIMGLRAFTSQLLCEQVIGRGLRRVTYDKETEGERAGLFVPEYVNVFGVPLTIFEDATNDPAAPPTPKPSVQIEVVRERGDLELTWPNVLRVDTVMKRDLQVEWPSVPALTLNPATTIISADLAPAMNGASDMSQMVPIDLELVPEGFRLQRLTFLAAQKCLATLSGRFTGENGYLLKQLVKLVEVFLKSDRLEIPSLFHQDPIRRRILIGLNMDLIVDFVARYVKQSNRQALELILDDARPLGRTGDMRTWYTTKPHVLAFKSHLSHVVGDSTWEGYAAGVMEKSQRVQAYAKNDHLGFEVSYLWNGSRRRCVPDFIVKGSSGANLVLELKGQQSPQNDAKHAAMAEWVAAVNEDGRFGLWKWAVAYQPVEVHDIIAAL
jgi:type III restriction enzyme